MLPYTQQIAPTNNPSVVTPVPAPTQGLLTTSGEFISRFSVNELYSYLNAWKMDGSLAYREPRAGELNMEQALAYMKTAIQEIVNMGAFSANIWDNYRFTDAQLLAKSVPVANNGTTQNIDGITVPASIGRWIVSFESDDSEGKLVVTCDAITGTIYEIRITDDVRLLQVSPDGLLNLLAVYFKLSDDGCSYTEYQSGGNIMSNRFELLFQSENADSYTFSINLRTEN